MNLLPFDEYAKLNGVTVTPQLEAKPVAVDLIPMLKKNFLKFFASSGLLDEASQCVGLNRGTVLDWHANDPLFKKEFEEISDKAEVLVRDALMQRALSGKSDAAAMFILKSLNPEKYDDKARTPEKAPNFILQMVDVGGSKLVDTSDAPKALPLVIDGEVVKKD